MAHTKTKVSHFQKQETERATSKLRAATFWGFYLKKCNIGEILVVTAKPLHRSLGRASFTVHANFRSTLS